MLIADCGSSWSKIRDLDSGEIAILPTQKVLRELDLHFDVATGHLGRDRADRYENELIALAQGSLKLVDEDDFTVVDIGSRDTKWVSFHGRKLRKLDWNQACGANTGFTLELLAKYYDIDFERLAATDEKFPVTCGIFGIERIFEAIIQGESAETALGAFVHGIAFNVHNFVQRPKKLYLSGGMCENRCFMESLARYCEIIPLGRYVLLEGLA